MVKGSRSTIHWRTSRLQQLSANRPFDSLATFLHVILASPRLLCYCGQACQLPALSAGSVSVGHLTVFFSVVVPIYCALGFKLVSVVTPISYDDILRCQWLAFSHLQLFVVRSWSWCSPANSWAWLVSGVHLRDFSWQEKGSTFRRFVGKRAHHGTVNVKHLQPRLRVPGTKVSCKAGPRVPDMPLAPWTAWVESKSMTVDQQFCMRWRIHCSHLHLPQHCGLHQYTLSCNNHQFSIVNIIAPIYNNSNTDISTLSLFVFSLMAWLVHELASCFRFCDWNHCIPATLCELNTQFIASLFAWYIWKTALDLHIDSFAHHQLYTALSCWP